MAVTVHPTAIGIAQATGTGPVRCGGPTHGRSGPNEGGELGVGGLSPHRGELQYQWEKGAAAGRELPNELVAAAVGGDCRAREELLALVRPLVLRYCRARLGRQESVLGSADDVAQEVCVAVVAALGTYQPQGLSFRAFVYGIAAHKVTDAFRAIGRDRTEPVAELPDIGAATDDPEHRTLAAERCAALHSLLAHLTPRQREVLVLRVAVGVSAEETARAVHSTPGAVRVTQHRALLRLRRIIEQGELSGLEIPDRATDHAVVDEELAGLARGAAPRKTAW